MCEASYVYIYMYISQCLGNQNDIVQANILLQEQLTNAKATNQHNLLKINNLNDIIQQLTNKLMSGHQQNLNHSLNNSLNKSRINSSFLANQSMMSSRSNKTNIQLDVNKELEVKITALEGSLRETRLIVGDKDLKMNELTSTIRQQVEHINELRARSTSMSSQVSTLTKEKETMNKNYQKFILEHNQRKELLISTTSNLNQSKDDLKHAEQHVKRLEKECEATKDLTFQIQQLVMKSSNERTENEILKTKLASFKEQVSILPRRIDISNNSVQSANHVFVYMCVFVL